MTFQPDIIISWDISEKDIPIIQVTEVKYDPKVKNVVGNVIASINAGSGGAISINQLMAQHIIQSKQEDKQ